MAGRVASEDPAPSMHEFEAEVCIDVREKALIRIFDERAKGHIARATSCVPMATATAG